MVDINELKLFANWLWDMDRLKLETQVQPFENADKLVLTYIKTMKEKALLPGKESKPFCILFNGKFWTGYIPHLSLKQSDAGLPMWCSNVDEAKKMSMESALWCKKELLIDGEIVSA